MIRYRQLSVGALAIVLSGCPQGTPSTNQVRQRADSDVAPALTPVNPPGTTSAKLSNPTVNVAEPDGNRSQEESPSGLGTNRTLQGQHAAAIAEARRRHEKTLAQEHRRQTEAAKKWEIAKGLPNDQRIKVAIECLCAYHPIDRRHLYNSETGIRVTREAREYLIGLDDVVIPELSTALRRIGSEPNVVDKLRLEHLIDLLGKIGERSAVVPLVERLLNDDNHFGFMPGLFPIATSLAEIGDEQAVSLLIEAYPWLSTWAQDHTLLLVQMHRTRQHFPMLLQMAKVSEAPAYQLLTALGVLREPICEPLFVRVLQDPDTKSMAHHAAIKGLTLLETEFDLEAFCGDHRYSLSSIKEWAPEKYPINYKGRHAALETLVRSFIAAKQSEAQNGIQEQSLKLTLHGSNELKSGETLNLQLKIENTGSVAQTVLRSRDGSDCGMVCPQIRAEIWGPDNRFVIPRGVARCGNVGRLSKQDFLTIDPNESVQVINNPHHVLTKGFLTHPGSYRIRAIYDTNANGSGGVGDNGTRPAGVIPVHLVSQVFEFEVAPR